VRPASRIAQPREPDRGGITDPAVPLTLLTGFLGAGKTTLVNHVLQGGYGEPVAVLVNDFGALNIDRALISSESAGVMSLENGCICCTLRGDLVESVMGLLQHPDAPRRVLLEASGIADPAAIAGTFLAPAFRRRVRLDGIVCVVDAEQALSDPELVPLQLRQVAYSDLVILNKADLAGPARIAELSATLRAEFAGARLVEAVRCAIPAGVLFSPPDAGPGALRADSRDSAGWPPDAAKHFATWSFETGEAFSADALHELPRRLPSGVYRAKGIVRVRSRGTADRRGILHVVGRRADLVTDGPWREGDETSQLVFIGAASLFEAARIEELVRACLDGANPGATSCGD
jgi:G3E family GTPase